MLVFGVIIVILGLVLLFSHKAKAAPTTTPPISPVKEAKILLEGAGVTVPEQPVGLLTPRTETKVIEQLGVEVQTDSTAYVQQQLARAALAGDISGGIPEDVFEEYFQKPAAEAIGLTIS